MPGAGYSMLRAPLLNMATLQHFADVTTVHGLRDCIKAESRTTRAVWCAVLVVAFTFLFYEMHQVLQNCYEERTVMSVKRVDADFPNIMYCPATWADEKKLVELGIDSAMYVHIESLMFSSIFIVPMSQSASYDAEAWKKLETLIESRFNGSTSDLLLAMSKDIEDVVSLTTQFEQGEDVANISKFVTVSGVCYYIEERMKYSDLKKRITGQSIFLKQGPVPFGIFNESYIPCDRMTMTNERIAYSSSEMFIRPRMKYYFNVRSYHFEDENLNRQVCDEEGSWSTQTECYQSCMNRLCEQHGCYIYTPNLNTNISFNQLCSQLPEAPVQYCGTKIFSTKPGEMDEVSKNCDCPTPCKRIVYDTTATPFADDTYVEPFILLKLVNPGETVARIESKLCTFEGILASLGGIISLVCGASLFSIAQMFTFFLCKHNHSHEGDCPYSKNQSRKERITTSASSVKIISINNRNRWKSQKS